MSKLDELIQELCPDGVEFTLLKNVAEIGTGSSNGNEAVDEGAFPFFIRSQTVKAKNEWEYDEEAIIIPGEGGIGDIFHYVNGKYALHQRVYRIHFLTEKINVKFAYYCMTANFKKYITKKAVSATVTSIRKPMIETFAIPVPPLPVQREIVRILDKFTALTAELTAELTARKKQYEYYRNKLLRFDSDAPIYTIGELCTVVTGGESPADCIKGDVSDSTHPYPVWGNGKEVYGYSGACKIDRDAVVISSIGANTGAVYYRKAFFTPIIRLKVVMPNDDKLNARFLFHALSATEIKSKSSSVPNMNANEIKAIKIPVPSIDVQKRIVNVLDNFDAICSDLKIGLPAEIETRKKQYEFYREKLLAFHEISN